jgi:hypothetical protein
MNDREQGTKESVAWFAVPGKAEFPCFFNHLSKRARRGTAQLFPVPYSLFPASRRLDLLL